MKLTIAKIGNHETISFAAKELCRILKEMDPNIVFDLRRYPSYNENLKDTLWIGLDSFVEKSNKDSIYIDVKNGAGIISGSNECSVLIAAYRFTYELGCRFLRPGRDGEKIPKKELSAEELTVSVNETASYFHRAICIEGSTSTEHVYNTIDWLPKVGLSGYFVQFFTPNVFFRRYYGAHIVDADVDAMMEPLKDEITKRSLKYHAVGHGWTCESFGISTTGWLEFKGEIPEDMKNVIAMLDGKRELYRGIPANTNLCYSNPYARDKITNCLVDYCKTHREVKYLHFWLADEANNQCECENCRDTLPSDFYVMMLNDIDRKLTEAGVDTKIVCLIYNELLYAPQTEKILNPERFTLMFAPITRSYSHSYSEIDTSKEVEIKPYVRNKFNAPTSVEENVAMLEGWKAQKFSDSFIFDYHLMWDHHTDPGYYYVAKTLHSDMANLDKLGLDGMVSCQLQRVALPTGLPQYAMAAALWDKSCSFEDVAKEYFTAAFGIYGGDVEKYLSGLSDLFDPEFVRGEKKKAADVVIKDYTEAKEVINCFRDEFIDKNVCLSPDWQYLSIHAELCLMLADVYIAIYNGDEAGREEAFSKLKEYVGQTVNDTYNVLDEKFIIDDLWKYYCLHI
ncbi:MAG: DUF4838 domain-containing protein [Ruminococcaceae bacterium]|nr:DUF4838 domain-containing protein [Oscillospiraceae bacterium]